MLRRFFLGALLAPLLALASVPASAQQAQTFNQRAVVNFTGSGDNTVITGVAGQRIYVFGFDISLSASTTFTIKSGSTALTEPMTLNAYSHGVGSAPAFFVTNAGDNLVINLGTSATAAGIIWYAQQ